MTRPWKSTLVGGAGGAALLLAAVNAQPARDPAQDAVRASHVGYSVGFDLGRQTVAGLAQDEIAFERDALIKGFADGLTSHGTLLTPEQVDAVLVDLHRQVAEGRTRRQLSDDPVFKALADENLKRGREFREAFAKKTGVISLPGGILYLPVKSGAGAPVATAAAAVVTYEARLINRREVAAGEEQEFRLDNSSMIEGGKQVLRLMRAGDRWQVAIPPELGYGVVGKAPDIGPNETLVVDVEVVSVK